MKKILFLACLFLAVAVAQAQVDRSQAPRPAPAREIKIGEYQTFTLKNGLQVFVVENHKLPRVQFSLQLKNDPVFQGEKEGYVEMAGTLIGTGTKTKTKAQLDEEVDFIGATLSTSSNGIFASSLSRHTTKLLDLLTDVLYNPAFSPDELDKLKTQTLSGIAAGKENPDVIARNVHHALVYGKEHPYGLFTTEKSVESITLEDCKAYYNTYFKPNNAYLIIVGDIDLKTVKSLTKKYFSKWTKGEVKNPTYAQPKEPVKTYVALVDRPASVQSVINISHPVDLKPGPPDAIKSRITNQILGIGSNSRLYKNLRETHGYTYGAYSQLGPDNLVGNFNASASVRNEVTDSALVEFMTELRRIINEPVSQEELDAAKAEVAGSFGRSLEQPQTIAGFALNTARYNLPKDYYTNYLKAVDAVTLADVQVTAKKFIRPDNAHIIVVGKASEVAEKLKAFGEVKYFDVNGDSYIPAKASNLPEGLTAEKVIANYVDAIGGEQKLKAVTAVKTTMKASVQGMEISISNTKKAPNKSITEVSGNGMVFNKIVSDGKDASMLQMGQKVPLDEKTKDALLTEGAIIPETLYETNGAKLTLTGVEKIEESDAYAVEIVTAAGAKSTSYFDTASGLKVKTVSVIESPQGTTTQTVSYQDYKEVNGVKFPHTVLQNMGPMTLKAEVVSLEVNPVLDDALFVVDK